MALRLPTTTSQASLPVAVAAAAAFVGLTLLPLGATRMWAWPWVLFLHGGSLLAIVAVALLLLDRRGPTLRLAPLEAAALGFASLSPLASALAADGWRGSLEVALIGPGAAALGALVLHARRTRAPAAPDPGPAVFAPLLAGILLAALTAGIFQWWLSPPAADADPGWLARIFRERNQHPLGHSLYTAGLAVIAAPLACSLALANRGGARLGWAIGAVGAVTLLLTTGSRAGAVGLAAAAAFGALAALRTPGTPRRALAAIVCAVGVAGGVAILANDRLRDRLLDPPAPDATPHESDVQRAAMRRAGLLLFAGSPILGVGPGKVPLAYPAVRHSLVGGGDTALQLHSTPIHLAAEQGLAGLVATGALLSLAGPGLIRSLRRGAAAPGDQVAAGAAAALVGYGVLALFDHQIDVPVFAIGVVALAALTRARDLPPGPDVPRWAGMALASVPVLVALALVPCWRARAALASGDPDAAARLCPSEPAYAIASALARLDQARSAPPADRDQRIAEATRLLQAAAETHPSLELPHTYLGWLLLGSDPAAAGTHFTQAAALAPTRAGINLGRALASLGSGRRSSAVDALAAETLADLRFLASPVWEAPALRPLRSETVAEIDRRLAAGLAQTDLPPWVRREMTYARELLPWLQGQDPDLTRLLAAADALQRTYFSGPPDPAVTPLRDHGSAAASADIGDQIDLSIARPGLAVVLRQPHLPLPVDPAPITVSRLATGPFSYLFPLRGHLPPSVILGESRP